MNYSVRLHPATQIDFDEAYEWYEDRSKGLGDRFLKAVRSKIEEIASRPEIYGYKTNKRFREAMVDTFPFIVVYKIYVRKKEIYISSVHHAKKHPRKKYRIE